MPDPLTDKRREEIRSCGRRVHDALRKGDINLDFLTRSLLTLLDGNDDLLAEVDRLQKREMIPTNYSGGITWCKGKVPHG